MDRDIKEEIAKQKKLWFGRECEKLTTPGSHRVSYGALRNLNKPGRPKPWNPSSMYAGVKKEVVLENLADFFNRLSVEFNDLNIDDLPITFDRDMLPISADRIAARIKSTKKTKSTVLCQSYLWMLQKKLQSR